MAAIHIVQSESRQQQTAESVGYLYLPNVLSCLPAQRALVTPHRPLYRSHGCAFRCRSGKPYRLTLTEIPGSVEPICKLMLRSVETMRCTNGVSCHANVHTWAVAMLKAFDCTGS